jgi:hypothetical protein
MQITLDLPDNIARQLAGGQDLSRAALEALVSFTTTPWRIYSASVK